MTGGAGSLFGLGIDSVGGAGAVGAAGGGGAAAVPASVTTWPFAAEGDRRVGIGEPVTVSIHRDRHLVAVEGPPLVDLPVAGRVAFALDARPRRRVEEVPGVEPTLVRGVELTANELAVLEVLDRVHDAVVVVVGLAAPELTGLVVVLAHVRLAVVVEVGDAADLRDRPSTPS